MLVYGYMIIIYSEVGMIIYNLLFMLLTNTLLPSLPLPPHAYILLPVAGTIAWKQPSAYEFLRLNRIHNETELKGAFREVSTTEM